MLQSVLSQVESLHDPNLLIGYQTADDAAVYQLDEETALVQTVDFFTPVVDDPYLYGQIAAANALSDVYAMGGRPRFALSIVGFPKSGIDTGILLEIIRGGTAKLKEAQVVVAGGHSVQDPEIKFGYCVTGLVHPLKFFANDAAQPGDRLILTKPLGAGIITTGVKFEKTPAHVLESAVEWMLRLNRDASEAALRFEVHAATDITGYALLGHAYEMAKGAQVTLHIDPAQVPVTEGARELARQGMLPGGIESNRKYIGPTIQWNGTTELEQQILLDPQTSGGLLLSVHPRDAEELSRQLRRSGDLGAVIGEVREKKDCLLKIGG